MVRDSLQAGMGVSGPAARSAIKTAVTAPVFGGKAITATTARRLLANQNAMIYDNPQALHLCHYKRDQALCHREGLKDTPSLHQCVPSCPNMMTIVALAQAGVPATPLLRADVPALVRVLSQLSAENRKLRAQLKMPAANVVPIRRDDGQ